MNLKNNVVGWFEIPVSDMERAIKFYETVFNFKLQHETLDEIDMAWFPFGDLPGAPGSLVYNKQAYKPSPDGVLIYFSSQSGDLNNELNKVEDAGGKILSKKKLISDDIGFMALFIDSEGNRIALHSKE